MPQPDYRLPDGNYTYSKEGMERRMAWEREQAVLAAEQRIAERYAPIEQTVGQWQQTQRLQAVHAQAQQAISTQLEDLQSRPLFGKIDPSGQLNEVQAAILKELQSSPKISIDQVYWKVVGPRLNADRTKVREEVLREINSQPRSTSAPVTSSATPQTPGPRTAEDYAREALNELKGRR